MQFTTPVGRMVYGSVWEGSDTDSKGVKRIIKSGPNAGKPGFTWSFGVAFPKVLANGQPNEAFNTFFREVIDTCRAGYPQYYTGAVDPFTGKPGCVLPQGMALKIKDGDGIDARGKPNNQKEGWAGCWVVSFSGMYAPRVFDVNVGLDPAQQLQDKSRVLPGDYVAVNGTCEANTGAETPGVYMNGNMVCFVGGGTRIVSGPKAADAFAGVTAGMLPPGCVVGASPASVVPVPPAPGVPVAGMPTPPTPVAVMPTPPAPVVPVAPVVPAAPALTPAAIAAGFTSYQAAIAAGWTDATLTAQGYLAAAAPAAPVAPVAPVMPTPPAPVVPPAPPAGPQMTAAGLAVGTYDSFRAANWSDDQMRAAGYIV